MIHTGQCKHCGNMKEEHLKIFKDGPPEICNNVDNEDEWEFFYDSGLAALDAHKEELYEAAKDYVDSDRDSHTAYRKMVSILNQIEKEK